MQMTSAIELSKMVRTLANYVSQIKRTRRVALDFVAFVCSLTVGIVVVFSAILPLLAGRIHQITCVYDKGEGVNLSGRLPCHGARRGHDRPERLGRESMDSRLVFYTHNLHHFSRLE